MSNESSSSGNARRVFGGSACATCDDFERHKSSHLSLALSVEERDYAISALIFSLKDIARHIGEEPENEELKGVYRKAFGSLMAFVTSLNSLEQAMFLGFAKDQGIQIKSAGRLCTIDSRGRHVPEYRGHIEMSIPVADDHPMADEKISFNGRSTDGEVIQ